jgi:hypothetical protein
MSQHDDRPTEQMADNAAELALLSACLWSKNARIEARKHLLPGDFWWPQHETVYDAMVVLDRHGKTVDPVTLRAALEPRRTRGDGLDGLLLTVTTTTAIPEGVADYAAIIRRWALRRRVADAGRALVQRAMSPSESPERLATEAVTMLTSLRDSGTDVTAMPLSELMSGPDDDDTPMWVIPNLLEAGDRLMLTGSEGAGKSALLRQLGVMPAAGVHPFTGAVMPPIKTLIVDCENKPAQVRRQTRPLLSWLQQHATTSTDPTKRVLIDTPGRINVLRDRDLSRIHQTIDAWQPGLVILGPIYRMSPKALNTDDEAAPFLAALDTITARGCAVVLEAHAGHSQSGVGRQQQRDLRPRGSSSLLGWPEFGLGLRGLGGGLADLEPWRGHREQRAWPTRMRRAPGNRWVETNPDEWPGPDEPPPPFDHGPEGDGTLTQGALL